MPHFTCSRGKLPCQIWCKFMHGGPSGEVIGSISRRNRLTVGGKPIPDTDSGLGYFSTFLIVAEYGILVDLLAFLIQSAVDFHDTQQNDWRRQGNAFTTFWERSSGYPDLDNPKILIRIPNHFWLYLIQFLGYSASNNGVTLEFRLGIVQRCCKWYDSNSNSIVTIAVSCIISEIESEILVENRDFRTPPGFDAP